MATTVTAAGKNKALNALGASCAFAAVLNSSDAEPSGGSPAYARKAITFAAANAGVMALSGTLPTFDIPAAFTVAKVAYYTLVTGGTQLCVDSVTSEAFAAQGTYTLTSGSVTLSDPA